MWIVRWVITIVFQKFQLVKGSISVESEIFFNSEWHFTSLTLTLLVGSWLWILNISDHSSFLGRIFHMFGIVWIFQVGGIAWHFHKLLSLSKSWLSLRINQFLHQLKQCWFIFLLYLVLAGKYTLTMGLKGGMFFSSDFQFIQGLHFKSSLNSLFSL